MSNRALFISATLFVSAMLVFMRSFLLVKLCLLALFLLVFCVSLLMNRASLAVRKEIVWFYFVTAVIGLTWAFVGALRPTNYRQGVFDALKLYVIWSAAFCILYTVFRSMPALRVFHAAMICAGILIPTVNLLALYSQITGVPTIPANIQEALAIEFGFGHGYFQAGSNNVISAFLVAPYLVTLQFRKESTSLSEKVALALSLLFVAVSGRRALWLVLALTPCLILVLSKLTASPLKWRKMLIVYSISAVIGFSLLFTIPRNSIDAASLSGIRTAFSADDLRAMQRAEMIHAFLQSPLLGSGFGGHLSGYPGSDDWNSSYELTYYQMAFNLGIVGTAIVMALFAYYFSVATKAVKQMNHQSAVPFGLLVALCSLLIGAYSNPYLGGFDSLCFVGLLPYLASLRRANNVEGPSRCRRMRYGDLVRGLGAHEYGSDAARRA